MEEQGFQSDVVLVGETTKLYMGLLCDLGVNEQSGSHYHYIYTTIIDTSNPDAP